MKIKKTVLRVSCCILTLLPAIGAYFACKGKGCSTAESFLAAVFAFICTVIMIACCEEGDERSMSQ